MSCNGCRVLRRGCSESCILRPCLQWIESPDAQSHATLFLSKFFGRSDLMAFISAVPENKRPALFQSLLFEACGRTVNPVNGAVGLLSTGNWHICRAAVETVLAGGSLTPAVAGILTPDANEASESFRANSIAVRNLYPAFGDETRQQIPDLKFSRMNWIGGGGDRDYQAERYSRATKSMNSDQSETLTSFEIGKGIVEEAREAEPKLLNLFL